MPATLQCRNLRKTYPGQDDWALGDDEGGVSFEVEKGEVLALLGPSGCGKTTTLRIIGGFIEPTSGTVEIEGRDVTGLAPYERPTNTVFQNYALFPHMDVGRNVAFGLEMERVSRGERDRRKQEALELVGLGGMANRKVSELSGGQQQRAAVARAIVKRPTVLLLDEPLGALDLKLRRQMQAEIVELKRHTNIAFVHVTHDQEEACAIADRIAVMRMGRIVQVDTPLGLYQAPRTAYVADFIDAGTVVRGQVTKSGGVVEIAHSDLVVRGPSRDELKGSGDLAALLLRDRLRVIPVADSEDARNVGGTVTRSTFTGSGLELQIRVGANLEVKATLSSEEVASVGIGRFDVGSRVEVSWDPENIVIVEAD